jgi:predicted transcriptional regulator
MSQPKPSRIFRTSPPEQQASDDVVRRAIEAERPAIEAATLAAAARYEAAVLRHLKKRGVFDLDQTVAALKAAREDQGLSLADVSAATGISKPNLSDLETGKHANPTLRTLQRYADAVGRKIVVGLVETAAIIAAR